MLINFFLYRNVLPNVAEQIVHYCNKFLSRINPDGPTISPDIVNALETQVLSIQNPENKIRTLVGNNIILIQYKI